MKIAISGKICSGKSTLANILKKKYGGDIISFADKIKEIAIELFGMKLKDRKLLIDIGTKMKEINENVWINYCINKSRQLENIFIDDLRFSNEWVKLKDEGFILIRLNITREEQIKRIKKTYPETWENHIKKFNDSSEIELDNHKFDYVFNENNINEIFEKLPKF